MQRSIRHKTLSPVSEACPRITAQSGDSRGGLVDVPVEPGADCDIRKEDFP